MTGNLGAQHGVATHSCFFPFDDATGEKECYQNGEGNPKVQEKILN